MTEIHAQFTDAAVSSDAVTPGPAGPELLDMDQLSKSLTGFEQIAVTQVFRQKLDSLATDSTMFMRVLLFVQQKRNGLNDADAFRAVMMLDIETVVESFKPKDGESPEPEDPDAIAERDQAFANFVIGTGLSYTVDEYMSLTLSQREAVISEANRGRR